MRTSTGTYTKSEDTYYYSVIYPEAIVFAHSRHAYIKINILDNDSFPESALALAFRVIHPNGSQFTETRYTDASGNLTIDIARILQIMTDNVKDEMNFDYENEITLRPGSDMKVRIYDGSVQVVEITFDLYNGADDIGDKWWNSVHGKRKLKWFKNYPFTFDFPNVSEVNYQRDNGIIVADSSWQQGQTSLTYGIQRVSALNTILSLATQCVDIWTPWYGFDEEGVLQSFTNRVSLEIDNQTYDKRKIYLRWIGKHGEVFYWLFDRHSLTEDVSREMSRRAMTPNWRDDNGLLDGDVIDGYDVEREMVVYSGMLDKGYYDLVHSVVDSPVVDILMNDDLTDPLWNRVSVKGGSYTESLKYPALSSDRNKQVVLTLALPKKGGISL